MKSQYAKGLLITASGVMIISPDGLLTRLIEADHWTMIFYRALFLSCGMWVLIVLSDPGRAWRQFKTVRGPGLLMVVTYSLGTISFIFAITHTSVANTLIILSTTPLFAAVVSRLLLHEKIVPRTMIAIALVASGLAVISSGSDDQNASLLGDLVALLGAFALACGFCFVRRFPGISSLAAISCSGLLTALIILPLAVPLVVTASDLVYLFIMGGVMLPLGTALMFLGPRFLPAPEVGLLLLLEAILGPFWVWLVLTETPGKATLFGGAIVISTLGLNTLWALKQRRAAPLNES